MIDAAVLLTFMPAALALNLTPGPDMLFCLGQGLRGGPRAALAADAGIALGAMIHVTLAGLGLGALVAAWPVLFDVIRWVGVAYLVVIAWRTLAEPPAVAVPGGLRPSRAFRDALMVNLTNPKVILFVLAFLPQFTDPARPLLPQFLLLGAIISAGGLIVNGLVGVFAGSIGARLARAPVLGRWLRRATAGLFGALALRLALERR